MVVQFGNSGKRINSTKIPNMSDTIENVRLKENCTIENPVLEMSTFNASYDVAKIAAFGRYYFVSNVECVTNNLFRYYLTSDPLASFKHSILSNTLNIERSQSHGVKTLIDPYATHTAMTPQVYQRSFEWGGGVSISGMYVLQTAGSGTTSSIGESVNTYIMSGTALRNLINKLFTASTYDDGGSVTVSGEVKTYFNPFQYIISCRWFPITDIGGTATTIKFGWWDSGISAAALTDFTHSFNATIIMPSAIDWTYTSGDYAKYSLAVPGFGVIDVDPTFCGNNISCQVFVDLMTGKAKCELIMLDGTDSLSVIASASGYWSVDVLLTQLSTDATNVASNIIQGASNFAYGSGFSETVSNAVNAGSNGLSSSIGVLESIPFVGSSFKKARENIMQPQLSQTGAIGNMTEFRFNNYPRLFVKHYDVLEPNMNATNGLPCHRNLLLSELSGYTICNNASIEVPGATNKEKLAIKNMLEGGFWIE